MTDEEITGYLRLGRRQGFSRACGVAFFAALASGAAAGFMKDPVSAAVVVATGVLTTLAVASFLLDLESGAS
jgi:hypothetical protein